jgi:hypothetical protein
MLYNWNGATPLVIVVPHFPTHDFALKTANLTTFMVPILTQMIHAFLKVLILLAAIMMCIVAGFLLDLPIIAGLITTIKICQCRRGQSDGNQNQ